MPIMATTVELWVLDWLEQFQCLFSADIDIFLFLFGGEYMESQYFVWLNDPRNMFSV
jgi:hypothetical protein